MKTQLKHIIFSFFAVISFVLHTFAGAEKLFTLPPGDDAGITRINVLYQNKKGYILAGTNNGLYRFDGIDFYRYSSADNVPEDISAICETPSEQTWIGFSNGNLGVLQNNTVRLLRFDEGYPKVAITKITVDNKGLIWIGTAGEGLYYYNHARLYNLNTDDGLSDDYVYDITTTGNAGIIAATDRGLNICTLINGKKNVSIYSSKNGLKDNIVRCLYTAANNSLWLGMQDAGFDVYNNKFQNPERKMIWNYGQVNDIIATSFQVFVATEDNGLIVFDHDDDNNIFLASHNTSQLKKISCLLRDREGNIWAAGDNLLLRRSGCSPDEIFHPDGTDAPNIHSLLCAKNKSIWFNTANGVEQIRKVDGVWKGEKFDITRAANTEISTLYEDKYGKIWIGTMGQGICVLDPVTGKKTVITADTLLVKSNIISITGKDSSIWISSLEGTVNAVLSGNNTRFINYMDIKSIGSRYVNHIFTDSKDRVWFATDGKGVTVLSNGKFTNLLQQNTASGNVVYRLVEDPGGNIWYSTYNNGLIRYNGSSFKVFTQQQGLSSMNITGLAAAGDNIVVFHKNNVDLIDSRTDRFFYTGTEQGIPNINADLNAFVSDDEGNVFFAADSSVYKFHASEQTIIQPLVMIDKIQLFLNDVPAETGHVFNHDENNISLYFTGLYYSQPEKIQYQYKLEGYNRDWVNTNDRVQNFPDLPPDNYIFKVRASLNKNFENAPEAAFSFIIAKPFWLNAWFIVLCIVLAASLFYFVIKQREKNIQQLSKLENEKIQSQLEMLRSQINPHFLFNSFNTLISEIETQPDMAVTYVEHMSDFYRSIVVNREKNLITLREELDILNDYFFIQQKRYGSALHININVTEEHSLNYLITPLALQLLIENAIKHNMVSTETKLEIKLFVENDNYLVVQNNINKKLYTETGGNLGLQNIRRRYEILCRQPVIIQNDDYFFTVKIPLIRK